MQVMKYSKEEILRMSWQEWNQAMADELNENGYTRNWWREPRPYQAGSDPKSFIFGEVGSDRVEEIECLKTAGLLNNGRCPLCGNQIKGSPGRFTSGFNHNSHFQICQDCASSRGHGKVSLLDQIFFNGGCLTTLLLSPIVYLEHIIKKK